MDDFSNTSLAKALPFRQKVNDEEAHKTMTTPRELNFSDLKTMENQPEPSQNR